MTLLRPEELTDSADQLGAILDRAQAEATFNYLPASYADHAAEARHKQDRIFCIKEANNSEIDRLASDWSRLPISQPSLSLRLFNSSNTVFGAVVAHNFSAGGDAELIVCLMPGLPVTRTLVRSLARWLFNDLDLRRVTLRIPASNMKAREAATRLRFQYEGRQRRWLTDDDDMLIYGMLRAECPWL
jgi:RimJ/RimL family protein N-acetyltransferase